MSTIGYLGPEGTFSHQAALHCLQETGFGTNLKPYPTIPQIMYSIESNECQAGVVPAENSIEGTVNITMDMLAHDFSYFIQQEIIMDINHHLFTQMTSLEQIETVMSHPQALAQCRRFLREKLSHVKLVETSSTAEAVRLLEQNKKGLAAIASRQCQACYHIPILEEDIGDYTPNQTRFLLVAKTPSRTSDTTKTSLVIALEKDHPGGLYHILGEFARYNINLTRIESRPAKKELGNYIFFIDCAAGAGHSGLQQILDNLKASTVLLKNLGSYTTKYILKIKTGT